MSRHRRLDEPVELGSVSTVTTVAVDRAPSLDATSSSVAGARILVLNWRDVRHPQAGGAEQFMHQIARRWVAAGAVVTWLSARPQGLPGRETIDGIEVVRAGGDLSLYPRVALALLRRGRRADYVVDCQNGIPFFSPLFVSAATPVVQVVHHVHQDQFATRFGPALAAVGRFLEGRAARRVYGRRPIAAVSPSTRRELRRRLGFRGEIHIVPNGSAPVPTVRGPRDPDPTIAVVTRLVPHKRVDLLLRALVSTAAVVPGLRVDIVGDGPQRGALEQLAHDLGLAATVTFHGYQPDAVRDELLGRAWLSAATSAAEGWGCSVIEAAGHGVPTIALDVPGIRDSVVDGHTGWLVGDEAAFGEAAAHALRQLAEEPRAREVTAACQAWARCFTWDRSAQLLAGVLAASAQHSSGRSHRRVARSDSTAVATFEPPDGWAGLAATAAALRPTDQVGMVDGQIRLVLPGCDETDALVVVGRLGGHAGHVRLGDRYDLLAGPAGMPAVLAGATVSTVPTGTGAE